MMSNSPLKFDEEITATYSDVRSTDSPTTRQKKMFARELQQEQEEKRARVDQMREDLTKEPEFDAKKMTKRQKECLRHRDYDAFFLESIVEDDELFSKQEEILQQEQDSRQQLEKQNRRIELRRGARQLQDLARWLPKDDAPTSEGDHSDDRRAKKIDKDRIKELLNRTHDDVEYLVRHGTEPAV